MAKAQNHCKPHKDDHAGYAISMAAFLMRTQALRMRKPKGPMIGLAAGTRSIDFAHLGDFLSMVANNISELQASNPGSDPAASAKSWFSSFGGSQPSHVNTWMGDNVNTGSESNNYMLANNADVYFESLSTTLWAFATDDSPPGGGDALHCYNWFRGQVIPDDPLDKKKGPARPGTISPPRPVKDYVKTQFPNL
jgi:hypothetical protein